MEKVSETREVTGEGESPQERQKDIVFKARYRVLSPKREEVEASM